MTISTISGTITNAVTAGVGNYAAALTITSTGLLNGFVDQSAPAPV